MIDRSTGALTFGSSLVAAPTVSEPAFAAAVAALQPPPNHSQRNVGRYTHHILRGVMLAGIAINATLIFNASQLESISLSLPSGGKSWDDWSEADEQQRAVAQNAWLVKQLGQPPYNYNWGNITSRYTAQGGSSSITVRYN